MAKSKKSKIHEHVEKGVLDLLGQVYADFKKQIPERIAAVKNQITLRFIEAQKRLRGETVVIIGPPEAGKTTLLKVLRDPSIESKLLEIYSKTEVESTEPFKCKWKLPLSDEKQIEFTFKIRKTSDVGGEAYVRDNHWGKAITNVSFILYVVDAKRLISSDADGSDYRQRIIEDFDWLLINSQKPKENFSVVIVANKIDLLCNFTNFEKFELSNKGIVDDLVATIQGRWKKGIRNNIKGGIFLSLLDPHLRQFTLDNLVLSFVGETLLGLYRKASGNEPK